MSEENYVSKDVYEADRRTQDASMARIEALMAASEARHERLMAEIRGEAKSNMEKHERLTAEIRGQVQADMERHERLTAEIRQQTEGFADTFTVAFQSLDKRIDDMRDNINVLNVVIAVVGLFIAGMQLYAILAK